MKAIEVKRENIPATGLEAVIRFGECYGTDIVWGKPRIVTLKASEDANPDGEPGIVAEGWGYGYAGFEAATNTYWRYKYEATPPVYREHCMQIISVETDVS